MSAVSSSASRIGQEAFTKFLQTGELIVYSNTSKISAITLSEEEISNQIEPLFKTFMISKEIREKLLSCVLHPDTTLGSKIFYNTSAIPLPVDQEILEIFEKHVSGFFPDYTLCRKMHYAIWDKKEDVFLMSASEDLMYGEVEVPANGQKMYRYDLQNYELRVEKTRYYLDSFSIEDDLTELGLNL